MASSTASLVISASSLAAELPTSVDVALYPTLSPLDLFLADLAAQSAALLEVEEASSPTDASSTDKLEQVIVAVDGEKKPSFGSKVKSALKRSFGIRRTSRHATTTLSSPRTLHRALSSLTAPLTSSSSARKVSSTDFSGNDDVIDAFAPPQEWCDSPSSPCVFHETALPSSPTLSTATSTLFSTVSHETSFTTPPSSPALSSATTKGSRQTWW